MDIDALRARLLAAEYTVDAVLNRLGPAGQAGLERNSTVPALTALGSARDPQATLIKLFPLAKPVPLTDARAALPLAELAAADLVSIAADQVVAKVDLRPYGFELPEPNGGQWDGWVISDHTPGLDHDRRPIAPDYVLGVSSASNSLAQLTIPDRVGSALDLGTGCGVQSLHLSTHAERIVATDVNRRALRLADLTVRLNGVTVDQRSGSLYEPVVGERFDLIVSNPPYVISPPTGAGERLVYREGELRGDDLVRTIVQQSGRHLNPGGTAQVLANWAVIDEPWEERVAGWAPAGCDLWVLERERLDVHQYIELWLSDAGLEGDPRWLERYQSWLAYFAELGIRAVGMGWITVVNAGRVQPDITIEQWPHEVRQPVGPTIAEHRRALDLATISDPDLLAGRWCLADDVLQETRGLPGHADPQQVVLHRTTGLRRAMAVDTALGGVLGACDGTLELDRIIAAVATLLDLDASTLQADLLPDLRRAVIDGYLLR